MLLLIGLGYAIPKYYLVDTKVAANDSCHNDKVSAQICLTLMRNQKVNCYCHWLLTYFS